jgi:hypothetical protein
VNSGFTEGSKVEHEAFVYCNGALNILKKVVGIAISTVKKPLSFIVGHNGVAPVKGCNTRDLGEPSPFQGGEEVRVHTFS